MFKIIEFFKEQWHHRHLIWKLSIYNIKSQYANHYLGAFWNILQPLLQVAIYYLVFGLGLRGDRADVEGLPFIVYLISGLFPWLFIQQGINSASNAIQGQLSLVTKMKFPASVLLSTSILNALFNLLLVTSIVVGISLWNGYSEPIHYLGLLYFIFVKQCLDFWHILNHVFTGNNYKRHEKHFAEYNKNVFLYDTYILVINGSK
jgi:ABC-type polysaccharide/polyol phosphate export systems, permease component